MRTFVTEPSPDKDFIYKQFPSWQLAEDWCRGNKYKLIGELVSEIPCDENYKADWEKRIDYDNLN